MSTKLFSELGLSPELLKAIEKLGFEQASPIQAEAIPLLMQGADIIGQSQTGSGKTAAFAIPAIEKVNPAVRAVQVLVLCPTRELAVQVSEEVHKLAFFKRGVRALPIFGGQSYDRQYAGLRAGAQIVIGTPGRVMDHMERGTLKLDRVHTVILDESDEMLDMGFRDDIEFILSKVPAERQTLFFSATLPREIQDLIRRFAKDPKTLRIEARALTVPTIEQIYYEVDWRWKLEALTRLIDMHDFKLGIVFCNTQRAVDELTEHLNAAGYEAEALHGGMAQPARDRVMKKFRQSGLEFLVATDIAGRGIDVDEIEVVVNYDLPHDLEDYVHRIGRTGRAGRSGIAITLVSGREMFRISQLERFTRQRLRRGRVPSHGEIEEARLRQLVERVRGTVAAGDFRHYDQVVEALLEGGIDSVDICSALLHLLYRGEEAMPKTEKKAAPGWTTAAAPAPVVPVKPAAPPVVPLAKTGKKRAERKELSRKAAASAAESAAIPAAPPEPIVAPVAAPVPVNEPAQVPAAFEEPATAVSAGQAVETASVVAEQSSPSPVEPPSLATPPIPEVTASSEPEAATIPPVAAASESPQESIAAAGESAPAPQPSAPSAPAATPVAPTAPRPVKPKRPLPPQPNWEPQRPRRDKYPPRGETQPRRPLRDVPWNDQEFQGPQRPGPKSPPFDRPFERRPFERRAPAVRPPAPLRTEPAPVSARERYLARRSGTPLPPEPAAPVREELAPVEWTRLWLNVGSEDGAAPGDILGAILGETGLPRKVVGSIEVAERRALVNVESQHSRAILSRLNRTLIRGRQIKAKVARENSGPTPG